MMVEQPKTVEGLVAGAVLQKPLGVIEIGGRTYTLDRPRLATHALVSELIAGLPGVKLTDRADEQIAEALRVARDCAYTLSDIAAVLILGAGHLEGPRTVVRRRFFGLIPVRETIRVNFRRELADKLFAELSPQDCKDLIVAMLGNQQLSVFFGVITSLYEANLLKPTSEVPTTAFGL